MKKVCKEINDELNTRRKTATAKPASQTAHMYVAGLFSSHTYSHSSGSGSAFSQSPVKGQEMGMNEYLETGRGMGNQQALWQEEPCSDNRCCKVHRLATCRYDLSAENGGVMRSEKRGKGPGKCTNKNKWHVRKRRHWKQVGEEEWRVRETIAGLREAHQEGRYF